LDTTSNSDDVDHPPLLTHSKRTWSGVMERLERNGITIPSALGVAGAAAQMMCSMLPPRRGRPAASPTGPPGASSPWRRDLGLPAILVLAAHRRLPTAAHGVVPSCSFTLEEGPYEAHDVAQVN
jgi:hypothetical protein